MTEAAITITAPTVRDDQIQIIKNTIAKGCSDSELAMFIQTCNRLGLDPFARQIFIVKRYDSKLKCEVATPQVSIDGLRLVAERTRQYRGQTAPQWCGKDGVWTDVWLQDFAPSAARVGVYRAGFAEPLVRVARWDSYVQTTREGVPNTMWAKLGDVMLAKCAESLALRSAFPNELSGVYTSEEMPEPVTVKEAKPKALPRTLDDVAQPDADGVVIEQKPAKAEVPYTVEGHIKALELCRKKHLQPWLVKLFANERSRAQEALAYSAFQAKAILEGVTDDAFHAMVGEVS